MFRSGNKINARGKSRRLSGAWRGTLSWELEVNKLEEKQVKQLKKKREVEQQFEELKLKEKGEKVEDDRQPACGDAPAWATEGDNHFILTRWKKYWMCTIIQFLLEKGVASHFVSCLASQISQIFGPFLANWCKNQNTENCSVVFGWHWIKSPPPPLPPSVRDVRTRLCQVQVRIFNAASLYHHPPRKHSTPPLPYFVHCQSYHVSTTYWGIGIPSKVLYIMHREQGKYLPRNVSVLSS